MQPKEILLVLTDRWADWEAAYAIAEIHSVPQYTVKTVALDKQPKASIGGLRAEIDYTVAELTDFSNTALLLLPGGFSWKENRFDELADFVRRASAQGVLVAAICGATQFLARHGLLDHVRHTGDAPEYFENLQGYNGQPRYVFAQVVEDGNFITANETAAVAFAHAIFHRLKIDTPEEIDAWYRYFQHGAVKHAACTPQEG